MGVFLVLFCLVWIDDSVALGSEVEINAGERELEDKSRLAVLVENCKTLEAIDVS